MPKEQGKKKHCFQNGKKKENTINSANTRKGKEQKLNK